jgi:4-methylaminobutanoate oxidase (formaldehyde-forming)
MVEAGEPLNQAYVEGADWEVEIAGRCYPATASIRPLYDPQMLRVKR